MMKNFIIKVLTFAAILVALMTALKVFTSPFWGNPLIENKVRHLSQQDEAINTIFIGSSKTYRHIDPILFDEITDLNSYNLGSSSMFYIESQYVLDHLLKDDKLKSKLNYVFQQDRRPKAIGDTNMHTIRSKYCIDRKRWRESVDRYWSEKNYHQVYNYTISYLENLLCIGEIGGIFSHHIWGPEELPEVVYKNKGFYPLDQQLVENPTKGIELRRRQFKRIEKRLPSKINQRAKKIKINPSETKEGIDYFLLSHIKLEKEYMFDRSHFNADGALIYTEKLGNGFKQYLKE